MSETRVTVNDPDDPVGPPAYDGPAEKAGEQLAPGTYTVTDMFGRTRTLVIHPDGETTVTR